MKTKSVIIINEYNIILSVLGCGISTFWTSDTNEMNEQDTAYSPNIYISLNWASSVLDLSFLS